MGMMDAAKDYIKESKESKFYLGKPGYLWLLSEIDKEYGKVKLDTLRAIANATITKVKTLL
jgi:hypothetical protein